MKRVAICGASGYSGMELTRLLARHPGIEVVAVASGRWSGQSVRERLGIPGPTGALRYQPTIDPATEVDATFFATPADASKELVPTWQREGQPVLIDLSNAYRADESWVYGLAEYAREQVATTQQVANPGCYPTATQLGLLPLIRAGLLAEGPIMVDAKSGVTGAGRKVSDTLLFNELADNHYPYRVGHHQHVPELERQLEREVIFTPHLIPARRGLLVSCYVPLQAGKSAEDVRACLAERYADEPLVNLAEPGDTVGIGSVAHTPTCRVAVGPTVKQGYARVFSSIDNLLKGAASQAVQNLNLSLGLPETQGLM